MLQKLIRTRRVLSINIPLIVTIIVIVANYHNPTSIEINNTTNNNATELILKSNHIGDNIISTSTSSCLHHFQHRNTIAIAIITWQ
jgi:hypothetical protein